MAKEATSDYIGQMSTGFVNDRYNYIEGGQNIGNLFGPLGSIIGTGVGAWIGLAKEDNLAAWEDLDSDI